MAAAARMLNISASAVAQQLHALERELGAPLLLRVGRTMRMTEEGARVLAPARKLLRDATDLRGIAQDGTVTGELWLGACTTPLTGLLPDILAGVSKKFPQVNIHIQSGNSAQLFVDVEAGKLDAALVLEAPYPLPKTCDWLLLREEPLIVLAPRVLADRDPLALLREEPLIRYDRNQWGGRSADVYLNERGIVPRERFELNALNAIAMMVDRGLGVSIVPDWAPPWPEGIDIVRLQLPERRIGRRIGIVWSRSSVRTRLVTVLLQESERLASTQDRPSGPQQSLLDRKP
ncbi:LysR family transcriptional regulator [Sphingomonas sp. QA11]|uniref:LysR family transcriptional regulator n=1 Tax=Sphingomonas sp. QA11 TaxID=2950605 RepID=UPI0023494BBB|nr:LysR family transcriptional regulator [Sphingomonas sp. QA11]WCM25037.1 LysR family transcriptional regulator [Sphingomonas sp. QA11]